MSRAALELSWSSHPNFPDQVLLLGSHQSFRRISEHLVAKASGFGDPRTIKRLYEQWIAAMRSHEGYEEHKLYPFLTRRFGASFERCERGHGALHAADHAVRVALANAGDRAGMTAALRGHDAVLQAHLDHEEEVVIPLLLDLDRGEFDRYCALPLRALLHDLEARGL